MICVDEQGRDAGSGELGLRFRVYRDAGMPSQVMGAVEGFFRLGLRSTLSVLTEPNVPVRQAFLHALTNCEELGVRTIWIDDPHGLFPSALNPNQELGSH